MAFLFSCMASIRRDFDVLSTVSNICEGPLLFRIQAEMMNGTDGPIRSSLAEDPDFSDLVQEFVAEMPAKIQRIREFVSAGDKVQLQRAIHQLRGACGGYGFPQLTEAASFIEERMKAGDGIDSISPVLSGFIVLLGRVTSDPVP